MADTLISVPSAEALPIAARTRWRRRAESAWRPFIMAPVLSGAAGRALSCGGLRPGRGEHGPDGRHPEVDRPVAADNAHGLIDLGPLPGV